MKDESFPPTYTLSMVEFDPSKPFDMDDVDNHIISYTFDISKEADQLNTFTTPIFKDIILPEIEDEINNGMNFYPLRQIYHSLVLAKWFKDTFNEMPDFNLIVDTNNPVKRKTYVSPRLGVSHPINEQAVLYFFFGKFLQFPSFNQVYLQQNRFRVNQNQINTFGNPDLAARLGHEAHKTWSEKYSPRVVAAEMMGFYHEVLRRSRGRNADGRPRRSPLREG